MLTTIRQLNRPVVVLLLGAAANRMAGFVSLFLVLYLTSLGYSPFTSGATLTGYGVGGIAGVLIGGAVCDRIGARASAIVSLGISGLLPCAIPFLSHALAALVFVCFGAGLFSQMFRPAASLLLAEHTPTNRLVMVSAVYRLAINVGSTVAPLLGVYLATRSYTALFLLDGTSSITVAIASIFGIPRGPRLSPVSADTVEGPDETEALPTKQGYRILLRDRRFLIVVAAMFLTALAEIQYQSILPLQIRARHLSPTVYGAVVAINSAMVIAIELPLTRFVERLPRRLSIAVGSALIGCGLAVAGVPAGVWVFYVAVVVWTMGEMVSSPSMNAYPMLLTTQGARARYVAALTGGQAAGFALGPVLGTSLLAEFGPSAWFLCLGAGVGAGIGMWVGVRERPRLATGALGEHPHVGDVADGSGLS